MSERRALRVVFAGTPEFAATALARIRVAGFDLPLVLTQPDRPAGRGLKLQASPVKALAVAQGIDVAQPRGLRLEGRYAEDAAAARARLDAVRPDVIVVAAYGLILPRWVLELPRLGCLNIHASLLPRWRGAAPIHRAIEAGDTTTGVTIMQMDEGLDTGDMLRVEAVPIPADDSTGRLHDRLADLGARLIVEALDAAAAGALVRVPQPAEGVTYARKIDKAEASIDWTQPAAAIERRLRAFDPAPGANTRLGAERIKVWRAQVLPGRADPGCVVGVGEAGIDVGCGEGLLRLTELQRAGGKRLPARLFLQGQGLAPGQRFEPAAAAD